MRFQYAYQKIVDLKTNEKTQAEWLLSTAVGHLQSEQDSLNKLYEDKRATFSVIETEMVNSASVVKLQELQLYMDSLEQRIGMKLKDVHRAENNVDNKKLFLNSKMLDEKVWLKAKEKEQHKFKHEMALREQNELDEMATVRFAMRAR
jgi:flagellar FliJ protein